MKYLLGLFLMLVIFFESCAIHKEFPFICFNHDCVANQFKFTKVKASLNASFNKMNLKAGMRKKKRYANKKKKNSIEKKTDTPDEFVNTENGAGILEILEPDSAANINKPDSATTFGFNIGIGNLDTVIILKYNVSMDSISQEDSLMLRNFFNNRKDQKMREIIIQEYLQPNTTSKNSQRINRIRKYLIELKVPNFIITINNSMPLPDGRKDERIEIRVF